MADTFDAIGPAVPIESLPVGAEFQDENGNRWLVARPPLRDRVLVGAVDWNRGWFYRGAEVRPLLVRHVTVRADELEAMRELLDAVGQLETIDDSDEYDRQIDRILTAFEKAKGVLRG